MNEKLSLGQCKSCGDPIYWVKTSTGNKIVNKATTVIYLADGTQINGHTSHFTTCPDADKWRKKKS